MGQVTILVASNKVHIWKKIKQDIKRSYTYAYAYSGVNILIDMFQNLIFDSFINYENMTDYANECKFEIVPFPKKTIKEVKMFPNKN